MDNLGAHLQHTHVDAISFGIDHILSSVDPGSCMISSPRMQDLDCGLGGIVSTAYNTVTGHYGTNNGYGGGACGGSYAMNAGMNVNGNVSALNAAGVIRVPAHRPLNGMHTTLPTNGATTPTSASAMNNLTGLTFPWMESNRRYTKDRFTGNTAKNCPITHC